MVAGLSEFSVLEQKAELDDQFRNCKHTRWYCDGGRIGSVGCCIGDFAQ